MKFVLIGAGARGMTYAEYAHEKGHEILAVAEPDPVRRGIAAGKFGIPETDDTLRNYLPETSNIIRFGDLFTKVYSIEKNALIKYVFRPGTTMENLGGAECVSAFACRIRNALLSGEQFHETLGILK